MKSPGVPNLLNEEAGILLREVSEHCKIDNPTLCHGVAGELELWNTISGLPAYREFAGPKAARAARKLRALHCQQAGLTVWPSEDPRVFTPDLWVGFMGAAVTLAAFGGQKRCSIFDAALLRDVCR